MVAGFTIWVSLPPQVRFFFYLKRKGKGDGGGGRERKGFQHHHHKAFSLGGHTVKLDITSDFTGNLSPCVCLFLGDLTSQQHTSVSQGRICSDNFTCRHTKIEVADQTFYLTQSRYIDTGPASPSADPTTPGAWQGSHWSDSV